MHSHPWLRAFLILVAVCAAVVLLSVPAYAEDGHHKGGHHKGQHQAMHSYADIDADGDGKVNAEQYYAFRAARMAERAKAGRKMKNAGNKPTFEDLDLDGDGNFSAEEFAVHQEDCAMARRHAGRD